MHMNHYLNTEMLQLTVKSFHSLTRVWSAVKRQCLCNGFLHTFEKTKKNILNLQKLTGCNGVARWVLLS